MHSGVPAKIKRHLVCFAVSQQSVCIKGFPMAFWKHKTSAQALKPSIVSHQKVRPDWCRVPRSEVGVFKTASPNLHIKHNILHSLAGDVYGDSALSLWLKPVYYRGLGWNNISNGRSAAEYYLESVRSWNLWFSVNPFKLLTMAAGMYCLIWYYFCKEDLPVCKKTEKKYQETSSNEHKGQIDRGA